MRLLFCLLLIGGWLLRLPAQREGYRWAIGNGYALNFHTQPPSVDSGYQALEPHIATLCDAQGELLLYTNGSRVWNRQHQQISTQLLSSSDPEWVLIVPQPGSSRCYIFTAETSSGFSQVRYSVVDMAAQGGQGAVLSFGQVLSTTIGQDWTLAAQGFCRGSVYWLVLSNPAYVSLSGALKLRAYRIDAQGLNAAAVETDLLSAANFPVSNAFGLRFSPAGDRAVFYTGGTVTARFDPATGLFSQFQRIDPLSQAFYFEFSPSGRYLYASELQGSTQAPPGDTLHTRLYQYDLLAGSTAAIRASRTQIHLGSPLLAPQLAPDGQIYLPRARPDLFAPAYSIIRHPDLPGAAAGFDLHALPLPNRSPNTYSAWAPLISSHFFAPGRAAFAPGFAGPDTALCPGEPALLGRTPDSAYAYAWEPPAWLDAPQSPETGFVYLPDAYRDTLLPYVVTASDGFCRYRDTVEVLVRAQPVPPQVTGSRSVCPGAGPALYRIAAPQPGHAYLWEILQGGVPLSPAAGDSLLADWQDTPGEGLIRVTPVLPGGCPGSPVLIPVRISRELQPPRPEGPAVLCLDQRSGQGYSVPPAAGSQYTWALQGGTLTAGQGSPQVTVDWNLAGPHRIWVRETGPAADCAGVSDTLEVSLRADTARLGLLRVSVDTADGRTLRVFWPAQPVQDSITLEREAAPGSWVQAGRFPAGAGALAEAGLTPEARSYAYRLSARGACDTILLAPPQRSILLGGSRDTLRGRMVLEWTAYEGWPVERYEVWRRLDAAPEWQLIRSLPGDSLRLALDNASEGFRHAFRVLAAGAAPGQRSWSAEAVFGFLHPVFIPNVFSPNGDGAHDRWVIDKLELYPEHRLQVADRWGRRVLEAAPYRNGWEAAQLPAGVYYYMLQLRPEGRPMRGTVTVLR
ncbi:MAG: gliding motility-associated C-terminal domain-containing protein [Bacteroidia bacterium]|nr:gliding motility-associated C-terminal domain-containing protein [Bacteroidia bacterium]